MVLQVSPALPPGCTGSQFDEVLDDLRRALGGDNVLTGSDLGDHLDPYSFSDGEPPRRRLCCRVGRGNPGGAGPGQPAPDPAVDSVPRPNFGYGGAAPRVAGSIIVDLNRMNQVLQVDEDAGYALVEPGVSFSALHEHLRSVGSSLWVSVPDLSWGSLTGNALERGFGYTAR